MNKIRVFVVDDHPIILEGIRITLKGIHDMEITGEAGNAEELLRILTEDIPDVILLDITLPGMSGLDTTRVLCGSQPCVRVIILTADVEMETIHAAIQSGAKGYLSKNASADELITAIRKVHSGEEYFSQDVTGNMVRSYVKYTRGSPTHDQTLALLSEREIGILRLISEGLTYKEIGDKLSISTRTVEAHRNNIIQKLGLNNNAELIKYAIRHGISRL
jgi:two-component system response regulator NreC